jgi:hypothetical protein
LWVLVAMQVLKEGQGLSDEQMYEQAQFDMLTRSALGLINLEEEPPVESTYYLFRKRVAEHEEVEGKDLLEAAFEEATKGQCLEYGETKFPLCRGSGCDGNGVSADSKLMGSTIAYYRRYEVVHETMRKLHFRGSTAGRTRGRGLVCRRLRKRG